MIILDSVTHLNNTMAGEVAYCASHGGLISGHLALRSGLVGIIFCDAGVGLEQAGIAALPMLDTFQFPAAAIDHRSACIGAGQDGYENGIISYANKTATDLGIQPGLTCQQALKKLSNSNYIGNKEKLQNIAMKDERQVISVKDIGQVTLADSNSVITEQDVGKLVVCGSHGALLNNDPSSAVRFDVSAIIFNDSNFGKNNAGIARLNALDQRNIPAACVSVWSARIGDSYSALQTGIISALNKTALQQGTELGITTLQFLKKIIAKSNHKV